MISRRTFFWFVAAVGTVGANVRLAVASRFNRFYPGTFTSRATGREVKYAWEDVPGGILKFDGMTDNRSARARIDDGISNPEWFAKRKAEVEAAQLDHDLFMEELSKLDARPVDLESRTRAATRKAEILAQQEVACREWLASYEQRKRERSRESWDA